VHAWWHIDLLMGEALDLFAHNLNASLIASVHFKHGLLERVTEHLACHAENTGSFSSSGWTHKNQIWHVSKLNN